jgi:AcrR family transcriptional regulator
MVNTDPGHDVRGRRERKKTEVRNRLYEAAVDLFRRDGYDITTVGAITAVADVGKGTFFNYFPTKEHVLAAYHDEMTGQLLALLSARRFRAAEAAVREGFRECGRWIENDPEMARVVLRVLFNSAVVLNTDSANEERFVAWFRDQLSRGVERGELGKDLDIDLMVELLLNALSSTVQDWVFRGQPFDLQRRLLGKCRFLFLAARARPARPVRR